MHRAGLPPGAVDLLKFSLVFLLVLLGVVVIFGEVHIGDVDVDFNHFQTGDVLD